MGAGDLVIGFIVYYFYYCAGAGLHLSTHYFHLIPFRTVDFRRLSFAELFGNSVLLFRQDATVQSIAVTLTLHSIGFNVIYTFLLSRYAFK